MVIQHMNQKSVGAQWKGEFGIQTQNPLSGNNRFSRSDDLIAPWSNNISIRNQTGHNGKVSLGFKPKTLRVEIIDSAAAMT
jgi:hypothetical protein